MKMNSERSLGLTALLSMTIDGNDNVVTAIINASIEPSCAPLKNNASAIGIVANISAYIGIPINVERRTPKGLLLPSTALTHSSGIQLCIIAPIPTPIIIYGIFQYMS